MKYSNVKDSILEKIREYSDSLDKAIDLMIKSEDIIVAKNMKMVELRNAEINCLYNFAEYNKSIPQINANIKSEDRETMIRLVNTVVSDIFKNYIHADVLYCGKCVIPYLMLMTDWISDNNTDYEIKDYVFNRGILFGMKIKRSDSIPKDEFVYVDNKTDEIIKCKINGLI